MDNNIFGKRLATARKMAGLSLQALADSLGNITKQALNKYEQGLMKPDSTNLILLAQTLNVSVDFFFYEPLDEIDLGQIQFRKFSSKINKTQGVSIEEKAKEYIARRLRVANLLGERPTQESFEFRVINSIEDIEEAANELRKQWNLGNDPIPDVTMMLEDKGFWIIDIDAPEGFDGFHANVLGNEILVLKSIAPQEDQVRKRMSLLHELGHAILKFPATMSEKEQDKLCTAFASAILFPKEMVKREMWPGKFHFYTQELYLLKQKWGISIKAIMYRAYSLGLIKDFIFKKMMISYNSKFKQGEKKIFTSKETPTKFSRMILQAVGMEVLSSTEAAHLLDLSVEKFREQIDTVA